MFHSLLNGVFSAFIPKVKAENVEAAKPPEPPPEEEPELEDPMEKLRAECTQNDNHIKSLLYKYEKCNDRVNSRTKTDETCEQELFDYLHALNHCVAPKLFKKLK